MIYSPKQIFLIHVTCHITNREFSKIGSDCITYEHNNSLSF